MKELKRLVNDQMEYVKELELVRSRTERRILLDGINEIEELINATRKELSLDKEVK